LRSCTNANTRFGHSPSHATLQMKPAKKATTQQKTSWRGLQSLTCEDVRNIILLPDLLSEISMTFVPAKLTIDPLRRMLPIGFEPARMASVGGCSESKLVPNDQNAGRFTHILARISDLTAKIWFCAGNQACVGGQSFLVLYFRMAPRSQNIPTLKDAHTKRRPHKNIPTLKDYCCR
jgi:hypothetical protein